MFRIRGRSIQAAELKTPIFDKRLRAYKRKQDFMLARGCRYPFTGMQCGQSFYMRYDECYKTWFVEVKKYCRYYNRNYHVYFHIIEHANYGIEVTRLL